MKFCPDCGMLLQIISEAHGGLGGGNRSMFHCKVCPYRSFISDTAPIKERTKMYPKLPEGLGGAVDESGATEVLCPKCDNDRALVNQMQTRSADEASTLFFQCTKCKHIWRE